MPHMILSLDTERIQYKLAIIQENISRQTSFKKEGKTTSIVIFYGEM